MADDSILLFPMIWILAIGRWFPEAGSTPKRTDISKIKTFPTDFNPLPMDQ